MASKTDIVNWALYKLGETRVANVETDNSEKARTLNQLYNGVRDSLIQRYPWTFALKRDALAPNTLAPSWGYMYAYELPSDYLAMHEIRDEMSYNVKNDEGHVVEGSKILTNIGPVLYLRYISTVTNENLFSALFLEAFSTRLAWEACEKITQSATKKGSLNEDFIRIIHEAKSIDAIERSVNILPESDWLESRI